MCGIFAYLGQTLSVKELVAHIFTLQHRGPDSSVVQQVTRDVTFGFHRLAINGLSNASNEPLQLEDLWLICNGEIYNHKQLEKEHGFICQTENDCEVILHLYRHFQGDIERVAQSLDGVFAFVLYDGELDCTFAANDPLGIRPLYYLRREKTDEIVFASEPQALAPMTTTAVGDKVCWFPHGTTWSSKSKNREEFSEYTALVRTPVDKRFYLSDRPFDAIVDDTCDEIYKRLKAAVGKRVLLTERPVGCLLSGGIDSSIVAALVATRCSETGQTLHLFTIAIEGEEDAPDLRYARLVVEHLRTTSKCDVEHHVVKFSEQQFLDAIADVVRDIQSYDITTVRASVGNYLIAKYIKENTDRIVIFNGDVSEEQFGSYRYFSQASSPEEFLEENRRLLDNVYQYDVLRSARCMEHFSLEPRTPFADRDLVEFAMSIDPVLKMFGHDGPPSKFVPGQGFGIEKYLLRKAFAESGLLPESVLWRFKEAFSDGVSSAKRSWHTVIAEHIDSLVTADEMLIAEDAYPHCTPHTKEAFYYRRIYENFLGPSCAQLTSEFWLPRFVDCGGDPSARTLAQYRHNAE